ncbi:MAG: FkbM family methyltransferase [Pseudomonadota bacterium]
MAEKKENRIQTAIRELNLDPRDVKLASSMLQVLTASRKAKRQSKYGEGPPTLAEFFEFALPRTKDAQGQLMQDLWVQFELGEINDGYFVEFGATNGITMSNSHILEKNYGWQGIVAEPNPDFHERLARERDCHISHKCVFSRTGEQVAFLCTEKGMYSRMREIDPADHNEESMRQNPTEIMVETVSLDDLLDQFEAPDVIDYMSVDTEGSELEILSAFDFSKRFVKTFTVEHNFTDMRGAIHDLLSSQGYRRRFPEYTRFDDWYIHQDAAMR